MDKNDLFKPLAEFAKEYIEEDLERMRMPSILLSHSETMPEGKQIILKHDYGRGRQ